MKIGSGNTEVSMFFAIVSDLRQKVVHRGDRQADEDIVHHLEELEAMAMHTQNKSLARRCKEVVAEFTNEEPMPATA